MEQRPLRLGDIVDDYCPRERRVTNHVIVALVDDGIRQTRCGTCDTEHAYKAARLPRRRKNDGQPDTAVGQLVSRPAAEAAPAPIAAAPDPAPPTKVAAVNTETEAATNGASAPPALETETVPNNASDHADDTWPAHRRLIRATLPRVEGEQKEPRPIPEFTMHQRQGRGGNGFRGDYWANGNGGGRGNGNGSGNGNFRQGQPGPKREGQPAGGGGKRWRHRRRGRGGPKMG